MLSLASCSSAKPETTVKDFSEDFGTTSETIQMSGEETIPLEGTEDYNTYIGGNISKGQVYNNYQNARFGFSADYPKDFSMDRPSENGDGLQFHSKDELAQLTIAGSNNVMYYTAEQAFNEELQNVDNPSYTLQKDNWYVVSWKENGIIHYIKSYVGEGSINTFWFEYPALQSDIYSVMVEDFNEALIPGDISVAW